MSRGDRWVFRVHLGGRELDLTLAEWEPAAGCGLCRSISAVVADSQGRRRPTPR